VKGDKIEKLIYKYAITHPPSIQGPWQIDNRSAFFQRKHNAKEKVAMVMKLYELVLLPTLLFNNLKLLY